MSIMHSQLLKEILSSSAHTHHPEWTALSPLACPAGGAVETLSEECVNSQRKDI